MGRNFGGRAGRYGASTAGCRRIGTSDHVVNRNSFNAHSNLATGAQSTLLCIDRNEPDANHLVEDLRINHSAVQRCASICGPGALLPYHAAIFYTILQRPRPWPLFDNRLSNNNCHDYLLGHSPDVLTGRRGYFYRYFLSPICGDCLDRRIFSRRSTISRMEEMELNRNTFATRNRSEVVLQCPDGSVQNFQVPPIQSGTDVTVQFLNLDGVTFDCEGVYRVVAIVNGSAAGWTDFNVLSTQSNGRSIYA